MEKRGDASPSHCAKNKEPFRERRRMVLRL